ncbi:MAG: hypothetical protein JNJ90_19320 [Saprospiraceae bacterium]|jgi:hypothetical protein|nr:hypothetical protein [Saprospiraceae bacterium]
MKHPVLRLLSAILFIFVAKTNSPAQSRPDVSGFVTAAGDAGREMALLQPAIQQVNKATACLPVIGAARNLVSKAQQTGPDMTTQQYESMQRELAKIEADLDKLLGTPCPKSCRDAFGDGHAGAKGWNRFVCKLGCIKINSSAGKSGG